MRHFLIRERRMVGFLPEAVTTVTAHLGTVWTIAAGQPSAFRPWTNQTRFPIRGNRVGVIYRLEHPLVLFSHDGCGQFIHIGDLGRYKPGYRIWVRWG